MYCTGCGTKLEQNIKVGRDYEAFAIYICPMCGI